MVGRTLIKTLQGVPILGLLLIATTLEASGDAIVRMAIYNHVGLIRIGLFLAGAALLLGYGSFLNVTPLDFGSVVGLYIATLFVVWQVIKRHRLPIVPDNANPGRWHLGDRWRCNYQSLEARLGQFKIAHHRSAITDKRAGLTVALLFAPELTPLIAPVYGIGSLQI